MAACDYVGIASGNKESDKVKKAGFTVTKSEKVDADKLEPITYDPENHTYRKLGEVVGKAFSDGKAIG